MSEETTAPEQEHESSTSEEEEVEIAPLVKEGDEAFEKLLAEEEEIERSTQDSRETPHFRLGGGD